MAANKDRSHGLMEERLSTEHESHSTLGRYNAKSRTSTTLTSIGAGTGAFYLVTAIATRPAYTADTTRPEPLPRELQISCTHDPMASLGSR
jgi:hypothetical protein